MEDRFEFEGELPPDLAELDAELSSISYEERPSFAPELEAELVRAWRDDPSATPRSPVRQLLAAGVAGLFMVGLGVPTARAALVSWVDAIRSDDARLELPAPPAPLSLFYEVPVDATLEDVTPALPPSVVRPVGGGTPRELPRVPEATFPEIADRLAAEAAILDSYPPALQRSGVGGTVDLLLWVDESGAVAFADVGEGSDVPELDEAALGAARSFRFTPARRRGEPVGTWVEFDVVFRPPPLEVRGADLPTVAPVDRPEAPPSPVLDAAPEWRGEVFLPSPVQREAGELLGAALGSDRRLAQLGSLERILAGDPPAGSAPTAWRAEASAALEAAMVRDPDNPAPLLALGRIRRNQGLRTEARVLFERGLQRAIRGRDTVSPTVLAELHFERGLLIKQSWIASRNLGRLPAEALPWEACAKARSSGGAASGYASVDRLVAWNYLCPAEFGRAMDSSFEYLSRDNERDFAVMMGSFRSAVEAAPGHAGANLEILLALADEGRWQDVLDGARRFVWASRGHPHGLLLSGLALQRMSRSDEAAGQFDLALNGMTPAEREAFTDIGPLLSDAERAAYLRNSDGDREEWRDRYFAPLDPIRTTTVNEREVEHLARTVYARLRFSDLDTDAGRIWVRYGRPDAIRVVGEGAGLRTEFWDYGESPDITFQRAASSVRMELTSEASVYVSDLMSVLPHRYGNGSRTVEPLDGQVSRFRGVAGSDLEVHARVPRHLATGAADSLELGFFLLDDRGRVLEANRGSIEARARPLALRTRGGSDAAEVIVELYHPREGRAAVLRSSLAPLEDDGMGISDLLLTTSVARVAGPVVRQASWLEPYTTGSPVAGAELGALVEVYGAAPAGRYRLRAEVESMGEGVIRAVPIRPSGETGYRPYWDRVAEGGSGRDIEFLAIGLQDVPPGEYTLRVQVDVPGRLAPLESERSLTRR